MKQDSHAEASGGVAPSAKNAKSDAQPETTPGVSRRDFLKAAALSGGAAATGISAGSFGADDVDLKIPSIRIPNDIPKSLGEAEVIGKFGDPGMTGAEVFARLCKEEELAGLFCCPGNYTIINAIAAA